MRKVRRIFFTILALLVPLLNVGNIVSADQLNLYENFEIVIVQQPENYVGKIGETAVFTVKATGEGLSYKWQYSRDGVGNWSTFNQLGRPSAATDTFQWNIESKYIGWYCRCEITDAQGNSVLSEKVQMLLDTGVELKITENPEDYTGKVGETAVYTVKAEGSALKYQWQYSKDGGNS